MHHYKAAYLKEKEMRFISHLDLMRTFIRALRRSKIPVAYSGGFNPKPKLIFAAPLALGMEGKNEYFDLFLKEPREEKELQEALNGQLPPGLEVKKIKKAADPSPTFSSVLAAALYVAKLPFPSFEVGQAVENLLGENTLIKVRPEGKGEYKDGKQQDHNKVKKVDIRPFVYTLKVKEEGGEADLLMLLATGSRGGVKPWEILELLPLESDVTVFRQDLFFWNGKELKTPCGLKPADYFAESIKRWATELCP